MSFLFRGDQTVSFQAGDVVAHRYGVDIHRFRQFIDRAALPAEQSLQNTLARALALIFCNGFHYRSLSNFACLIFYSAHQS
jgi:hypothetical protein